MVGYQNSHHLLNNNLKSHLKKKVKKENFKLIDQLLTSLSKALMALEKVENEVDMEWAKEMDLILVANVNVIGKV